MKYVFCLVLVFSLVFSSVSYAEIETPGYADVADGAWYAEAVRNMSSSGYIKGSTDGLYHPLRAVTRAEWITVLARMDALIEPVIGGQPWWQTALESGIKQGFLLPGELNAANAETVITRMDAVRWIYRSLFGQKVSALRIIGESAFPDAASYTDADQKMAVKLKDVGIIIGNKGLLYPSEIVTRAEMAVMLFRMLDFKAKANASLEPTQYEMATPVFFSGLGGGYLYDVSYGRILEFPFPQMARIQDSGKSISLSISTENGQRGYGTISLDKGTFRSVGNVLRIVLLEGELPEGRITTWLNGFSKNDLALFSTHDVANIWVVTGGIVAGNTGPQTPAEVVAVSYFQTTLTPSGAIDIRPTLSVHKQKKPETTEETLRYITSWEKLPTNYQPTIITTNIPLCMKPTATIRIHPLLAKATTEMVLTAQAEKVVGYNLNNAYRTPSYQQYLLDRRVKLNALDPNITDPYAEARTRVAVPYGSEHQAGIAMDMYGGGKSEVGFETTTQSKWMAANVHRFGLVVRYPNDKQAITRTIYEPWHIRYVGLQMANFMKNQNLCFEEIRERLVSEGCMSLGNTLTVTPAPNATLKELEGVSMVGMVNASALLFSDVDAQISIRSTFSMGREVFLVDLP